MPRSEWDADTGVIIVNPDAADATTPPRSSARSITNSGVMNYLNKFGQITPGSYKTYDPVSELYYAAMRYFKNLGNVPEWTQHAASDERTPTTTWVDGFPVITHLGRPDPVLLPDATSSSASATSTRTPTTTCPGSHRASGNEPTKPAAVTADTTRQRA